MALSGILSRNFSTSLVSNSIKNVTIVGAGLMGSGIAQVAAQAGNEVTLVEVNDAALQTGLGRIKTSLQRLTKKLSKEEGEKLVDSTLSRIKGSSKIEESVSKSDLVIEAIVENMEIKHKLFSSVDKAAPPAAILASNTSSLSITEIASVTNRKGKFVGLHFFNPVPMMKLLEVIRTKDTSDETYHSVVEWGKSVGKTTIVCKDTPGFVVNRLLVPMLAEAIRMMERGDASPRDIDTAMKLGAGYPMGPFELADYVGHDTTKFIIDGWHKKFPENPLFNPVDSLNKLVEEGKLGVKSGQGFYDYKKK